MTHVQKPDTFYAPRPSARFIALAARLAPWLLRRLFRVCAVDVDNADLARLGAVRDQRALLIANHPSEAEPLVLFHALNLAGVSAYCMAADTVFHDHWILRPILPRLGAYSVHRGRRDRASMETTNRLLVDGNRIVIFPEGEVYGLNDTLLPFRSGVVAMGFHALDAMAKQGLAAPLLVVPLGIKYVFVGDMSREIERSLTRLESRLGLPREVASAYERLRRIATTVVGMLEREQHLEPPDAATLDVRIRRVRETIMERLAAALQVSLPANATTPDRVRTLYNAYEDLAFRASDDDESEYSHSLRAEAAEAAKPLIRHWHRLHNFLAIRDGYVRELPSAERWCDVLTCLEKEVLGRPRLRGRRRAHVKVGEAIDLRDHFDDYRRDKPATTERLTRELENRVRTVVASLAGQTPPLEQRME